MTRIQIVLTRLSAPGALVAKGTAPLAPPWQSQSILEPSVELDPKQGS